ncbi:MAG: methyl-accepting chemotaxis protein [Clostridiales bacterium]|nr:methyl-accepting chemotaxis protein [Clostridiales bacterium]
MKRLKKDKKMPDIKVKKPPRSVRRKVRLPKMTIRMRLLLTSLVLLLVTGVISIFSIMELNVINQFSTRISEERVSQLNYAYLLSSSILQYRLQEYNHVVADQTKVMDAEETKMDVLGKQIEVTFDAYRKVVTDDLKPVINQLYAQWGSYLTKHEELIKLSKTDKMQALQYNAMQAKVAYDTLVIKTSDMVEANIDNINKISEEGNKEYILSRNILLIVFAVALFITMVMSLRVIAIIIPPVKKMQKKLTELVQNGGDLTQSIQLKERNEIGDLADSVNLFLANLRDIISEVKVTWLH